MLLWVTEDGQHRGCVAAFSVGQSLQAWSLWEAKFPPLPASPGQTVSLATCVNVNGTEMLVMLSSLPGRRGRPLAS